MSQFPSKHPAAGVGRRLGAMVYDACLIFAVLFAAVIPPFIFLDRGNSQPIADKQVVYEFDVPVEGVIFQLYLAVIIVLFFYWFWRKGHTLGMQAWKLQLETEDGKPITLIQSVIRLLGASISIACLGAGYWWIWIDKDKLSWHDRLSKSRIVRVSDKQ
jgi:uncharacterized RDD family membrane protein YckC